MRFGKALFVLVGIQCMAGDNCLKFTSKYDIESMKFFTDYGFKLSSTARFAAGDGTQFEANMYQSDQSKGVDIFLDVLCYHAKASDRFIPCQITFLNKYIDYKGNKLNKETRNQASAVFLNSFKNLAESPRKILQDLEKVELKNSFYYNYLRNKDSKGCDVDVSVTSGGDNFMIELYPSR